MDYRGNSGPPIGCTERIEEALANLDCWLAALPADDAILAADLADARAILRSLQTDILNYRERSRQLGLAGGERLPMEGGK